MWRLLPALTMGSARHPREYYWLKEELVQFCVAHGIPATDRELDILARIEMFLRKGEVPRRAASRSGTGRDSDQPLTLDTQVVNFKSDSKTREFFRSVIGPQFHFTAHLNDFMRGRTDLTYGDLVQEWLAERERRKDSAHRPSLGKAGEYNQFVRDYFADERNAGRSLRDAVVAWNEIKKGRGPRIYASPPERSST